MRLNLGCGDNLIAGYVNIDKYDKAAEVQADMADVAYPDKSVEEIAIYQALEHTPYNSLDSILRNCHRMLKPGGKLIIEVPDIEYAAQEILTDGLSDKWIHHIWGEYHRPWDKERYPDATFHAGSIHYQGFTYQRLEDALFNAGFHEVRRREMEEKHKDYKFEENLSVEAIKDER